MTRSIKIGDVSIGGKGPLGLIVGPCVIESEEQTLSIARQLKKIAQSKKIPIVFKASYDKANRSSASSYRGPGLEEGIEILRKVKEQVGLPVLSDVHCRSDVERAAKVLDCIQIPAFLCRQTDLIFAVADTGKPINIKKGQFVSPPEVANVVEKIEGRGNKQILLTERGTSFGYSNLIVDMRSLVIMRETGYPVVFDATHSVQLPGGMGNSSGGERRFVEPLARAAVAVGVDAIFLEVHPEPDCALCDGPNSIPLDDLSAIADQLLKIARISPR